MADVESRSRSVNGKAIEGREDSSNADTIESLGMVGEDKDEHGGSGLEETNTTHDLIAGWIGGAIGILISNPLDVLKVRLQTTRVPTSRVGGGSRSSADPNSASSIGLPLSNLGHPSTTPPPSSTNSTLQNAVSTSKPSGYGPTGSFVPREHPQGGSAAAAALAADHHHGGSNRPGLMQMWRQEGPRFLFAGAAAPIIGLAFIDSFFFAIYGRCMSSFRQDRQDPSALSRVFLAGATAGGMCALLQTPIEVVKCRAQAEKQVEGKKEGSFRIARRIASTEGVKGFYVGGLTTTLRDALSSGIFFAAYFVLRRLLRGEEPFTPVSQQKGQEEKPPASSTSPLEVTRILIAGGLAGTLSAIIPYPLDIIKTRLQTSNVASSVRSHGHHHDNFGIRQIARQIHQDGVDSFRYRYPSTFTYRFVSALYRSPTFNLNGEAASAAQVEKWTLRILGLKGFLRGLRPTMAASFAGSAVTIAAFELVLAGLSKGGSGGSS